MHWVVVELLPHKEKIIMQCCCNQDVENFSDDVVYFELISNMPNDKKTDFLHKVNLLLMG